MVAVLALGVVVAAAFKAWPLLRPEIAVRLPLDPACDLRLAACVSPLPAGGRVSLSIRPREIPVIQPLQIEVIVDGVDAIRVEVDFSGVDMNMGFNRPQLRPEGEGRFTGTAMLPVCIRDRMQWEALVMVRTGEGIVAAPYRFWAARPGVALPGGARE